MKKMLTALMPACLLLCSPSAWSQDDADEETRWVPVETFTCNFKDGKTMADLNRVIGEWNKWADKQGMTEYFAAVVTPQYFGEYLFDVGWIGAWKDANVMGADTDTWTTKGNAVNARFSEVVSCESHTNFASTMIKSPVEDDEQDDTFVLEFSNCTIEDDQEFDAVMDGLNAWAEYQGANGFQNSTYIMFPIFGETDDDYAFKRVAGHDNYTAWGADYERMGNGGHWRKEMEILAGLVSCDSPRVYDARIVRRMSDDE